MTGVTLALVGAGLRGRSYARHALSAGTGRVVAVAEPDPYRRRPRRPSSGSRRSMCTPTGPTSRRRDGWPTRSIIATQDQLHTAPAVRLADLGYHILLEKPMATSEREASEIADAARRNGIMLAVCHVLRYTPYTRTLKRLLDDGRIGRLVSVQHLEPVGWWHHAHSFVRGNWRREDTSAPMLLTKSCHDIDWLVAPVRRDPGRGQLLRRPDPLPGGGAPARGRGPLRRLPDRTGLPVLGEAALPGLPRRSRPRVLAPERGHREAHRGRRAARRCARGRTAAASTPATTRRRPPGGQHGVPRRSDLLVHDERLHPHGAPPHPAARHPRLHRRRRPHPAPGRLPDRREESIDGRTGSGPSAADGHGGGDEALADAFLAAVSTGDPTLLPSDAAASLVTHRVVWAAERARLTGTVVSLTP